jgi:hypothetical protein
MSSKTLYVVSVACLLVFCSPFCLILILQPGIPVSRSTNVCRTKRYQVITALTIPASYLTTSVRFYSRSRSTNGFRWNLSDTIIITSLVGCSGNSVEGRADERME